MSALSRGVMVVINIRFLYNHLILMKLYSFGLLKLGQKKKMKDEKKNIDKNSIN